MQRRILLLVTDLRIGGTPSVVRELALRLGKDSEFHVHVACLDHGGPVGEQLKSRGIAVTPLNAAGRFDLRVVGRLVRLIRREKIDTVLSFLVHANAAAAMASYFTGGVRFLQSVQTTQPNPRWHWKVQHAIAHRAQMIVVPSPSAYDAAMQWAGVEKAKLRVIPNAVDIGEFDRIARQGNGRRIGFIGRLDPIKRIEDLIAAMPLLPDDYTLDIFGDGEMRKSLQSMISSLRLERRITLHGEIAAPGQALSRIDLLVLPSDAEGFGLVLIEAMAAGVPVIGTNVPGICDVIEDGVSGLLCEPRTPPALADATARISNDPTLREKLIAGGIERVKKFYDWSQVIQSYRDLLG